MEAWERPILPTLPGRAEPPLVYDSSTAGLIAAEAVDGVARLYVCGITPYDATHIGHAATYLAFDTLHRVWRDSGYEVRYAQNVTDVDDPLLERATRDDVDWRVLATDEIGGFRADMTALGIIPPDAYVGVTEVIDEVAAAIAGLLARGLAYAVDAPGADQAGAVDLYFDAAAAAAVSPWTIGDESRLPRDEMLALFAERGGDPERPGKRDPLDALLWRAARAGEPSWDSPVGPGRPGWHIECAVIQLNELGSDTITVLGGGSDLIFPHHDLSAGHASALSGRPSARLYAHAGMVAYQGEKMSKSLGNLVKVAELRNAGVDPRAIRLSILAHHYRTDWEWTDAVLDAGVERLGRWQAAADAPFDELVLKALRDALHTDLDTPRALAVIDGAVAGAGLSRELRDAVELLLGIRL